MVSKETDERVHKAREQHQAARVATAAAVAAEKAASKELGSAISDWEKEYFQHTGKLEI
jgi:hypothetical protein